MNGSLARFIRMERSGLVSDRLAINAVIDARLKTLDILETQALKMEEAPPTKPEQVPEIEGLSDIGGNQESANGEEKK